MGINTFFQKFAPKEKKFYPMFEAAADNILEAAKLFVKLFDEEDPAERLKLFKSIKELENIGDTYTHNIFDELDRTFITPFDREDIHQLTSSLDNVIDFINGSSQRIKLYKPKAFNKKYSEFPQVIQQGCEEIRTAIYELKNMKRPQRISEACIRINEIENKADDIYHLLISELFEEEKDAIELIKKKEILQTMERATDRIEDVADVLKTILIKMA